MKRICTALAVLTVAFADVAIADDRPEEIRLGHVVGEQMSSSELFHILQSDSPDDPQNAARVLIDQYGSLMEGLAKLVKRDENSAVGLGDRRALAARICGHFLQSRTTTRALAQNIESGPVIFVFDPGPLGGYPNALALSQAGLNAVPQIVWQLDAAPPEKLSDHAVELFAHIILGIYRSDFMGGHAEAFHVMEGFHDRARKKKNLDRLLTMMQAIAKEQPVE